MIRDRNNSHFRGRKDFAEIRRGDLPRLSVPGFAFLGMRMEVNFHTFGALLSAERQVNRRALARPSEERAMLNFLLGIFYAGSLPSDRNTSSDIRLFSSIGIPSHSVISFNPGK
jgi:hypothetical protein